MESLRSKRFRAYLQRCKVYNTVDIWMCLEDCIEVLLLSDINMVELRAFATDEFNAIDDFFG